jgi:hypothetical protein
MAFVHKNIGKDKVAYLTFIDKEFKITSSGKAVLVDVKLCFPKEFVKTSENGKAQYISITADKLLDFILVEKEKKSDS